MAGKSPAGGGIRLRIPALFTGKLPKGAEASHKIQPERLFMLRRPPHTPCRGCIDWYWHTRAKSKKAGAHMTGEERRLVVEGFTFELTGFFSAEGVTTVTVSVNGK